MKKFLFISLGAISFVLGTLGILLPLLPTVPFYLLTGYLWFNSSDKLHQYLVNNRYYKQYIQEVLIEKKVTKVKLFKMLVTLFIILFIPFLIFDSIHVRCILAAVFVMHIIGGYFYFKE